MKKEANLSFPELFPQKMEKSLEMSSVGRSHSHPLGKSFPQSSITYIHSVNLFSSFKTGLVIKTRSFKRVLGSE